MIKKSKIITSICAIIMSTLAVIPAQAVSPPKNKKIEPCQYAKTQAFKVQNHHYRSEIDKAKQRINNVFYRINQAEQKTKNAQFESKSELKNIKSNFLNLSNLFGEDESKFANLCKEEFDQEIFSCQNTIDQIQNDLYRLDISLNKTSNTKINSKLLDKLMTKIENHHASSKAKKLRLTQFNNRLLQFKYRTDFCANQIQNISQKSINTQNDAINENILSDISQEFNAYLNDINNNINQLENLDMLHNKLNHIHKKVDSLSNRLDLISEAIKQNEHKKKVALTLKSATSRNAMTRKNEIKKLADEARQNEWPRNWIHLNSSSQNVSPYVLTLISYYQKTTYIPKKRLFIGKYQKKLPRFFFNQKQQILYEPFYRVLSRDVISEKSEDQNDTI